MMEGNAISYAGLRTGGTTRLALISGNVFLHTACHDIVNAWNASRPVSSYYDLSTTLDAWIPYIPWTWTVYYFGDLYILLWGSYVVWKMPPRGFPRSVIVYSGMIIAGALIQLALPARSPWPLDATFVQQWFHRQITYDPYVCLPSMHVALAVLPASMAFDVFSSRAVKITSAVLAALVSVSTVTLKEHYIVDVGAGVILALFFYALWKKGMSHGIPG